MAMLQYITSVTYPWKHFRKYFILTIYYFDLYILPELLNIFRFFFIEINKINHLFPYNSKIKNHHISFLQKFFQNIVVNMIILLTWLNEVSLSVCGPLSMIWCRGSSVANIPFTFLSPKYKREASSRPSCHNSCHNMATRISSSLT